MKKETNYQKGLYNKVASNIYIYIYISINSLLFYSFIKLTCVDMNHLHDFIYLMSSARKIQPTTKVSPLAKWCLFCSTHSIANNILLRVNSIVISKNITEINLPFHNFHNFLQFFFFCMQKVKEKKDWWKIICFGERSKEIEYPFVLYDAI